MKICFINADQLVHTLRRLMPELGFSVADEKTSDAVVRIYHTEKDMLSVTLNDCRAAIVYGGSEERFCRGLIRLVNWLKTGETQNTFTESI